MSLHVHCTAFYSPATEALINNNNNNNNSPVAQRLERATENRVLTGSNQTEAVFFKLLQFPLPHFASVFCNPSWHDTDKNIVKVKVKSYSYGELNCDGLHILITFRGLSLLHGLYPTSTHNISPCWHGPPLVRQRIATDRRKTNTIYTDK